MTTLKRTKTIAIVTSVLFFASFLGLMNAKLVIRSLEIRLENERLKSEELLSEKLLLEKDLKKIKNQLFSLQDRNLELDEVITSTRARLETGESEYNRMKRENISLARLKKKARN